MSLLDWPLSQERRALAEAVVSMSANDDVAFIQALRSAGIPGIGVDESHGGSGGDEADLATAIRALATLARTAAVVEAGFVSSWALRHCGFPEPTASCAPAFEIEDSFTADASSSTVSGRAIQVAGVESASELLAPVEIDGHCWLALVPLQQASIEIGANLAGEPRAAVTLDQASPSALLPLPVGLERTDLRARLALARAVQISGALIAVQELTVRYARTREQFGKALAEQQVVAHLLASIAEQSLLAEAAVATAIDSSTTWNCAIAKSVSSRAARKAARDAHQVHGAMGMSQEYPLGRYSTRLWSWSQEGGRAAFWEQWLGSQLMRQREPRLWQTIVDGREGSDT